MLTSAGGVLEMCWSSTTPTCSNVRSIQHDPNTTPARSTRYPHNGGLVRHGLLGRLRAQIAAAAQEARHGRPQPPKRPASLERRAPAGADASESPQYGDAEYVAAFERLIMPLAREFGPGLVIVSAGFDAAAGDPLGGMLVSPAGYAHMTHLLRGVAGGRVVVALEGGYNLRSIATSAAAVMAVLLGARSAEGSCPWSRGLAGCLWGCLFERLASESTFAVRFGQLYRR